MEYGSAETERNWADSVVTPESRRIHDSREPGQDGAQEGAQEGAEEGPRQPSSGRVRGNKRSRPARHSGVREAALKLRQGSTPPSILMDTVGTKISIILPVSKVSIASAASKTRAIFGRM